MLRWTAAGAVATPTTVQIRVQRSYPGRIRAGAPVPTRSMSPRELRANILHFTEGQRGPRTRPCEGLVLSGVGVVSRRDTADTIAFARDQGISQVVLHVGAEDLGDIEPERWQELAEVLVVPVQPASGTMTQAAEVIRRATEAGLRVAANTVLSASALDHLPAAARLLASARPHSLTFTYPFPINGSDTRDLPTPPRAMAALGPCLDLLDEAGLDATIKGLPACHLGRDAHRLRRTANRWYVDADHQLDEALLFFPDVVAFHKEEVCRFCSQDSTCDGFFATYLRRPGVPPLLPLD